MDKVMMDIGGVLEQLGLPLFDLGSDGYPIPGQVIKYYREQLTYTDRDGRERHWTQKDLAEKLGISEIMVNLMEKHGKGLDSIERRRVLSTILKIPPVLLGLGSLDQIVEAVGGKSPPVQQPEKSKLPDTVHSYQQNYDVYKTMYRDGLSYMVIHEMEQCTQILEKVAKNSSMSSKEALLYLLWQYEILCAKVYSSDLANWTKTFEHIDSAKDIATFLDDRDLQAASLCHSAIFRLRQRRVGLAKMDIDGASVYARGALPQTRGIIYSKSACIYAEDQNTSNINLIYHMLEEAEKYSEVQSDKHSISFGKDDFLLDKAYVYNILQRPAKSLEYLDAAERYIQTSGKRHLVFLEIKRAQCYIEQKKPEYEHAILILLNALEESKELRIARNIEQAQKLYAELVTSSYGKSPDVISLGMTLRSLR